MSDITDKKNQFEPEYFLPVAPFSGIPVLLHGSFHLPRFSGSSKASMSCFCISAKTSSFVLLFTPLSPLEANPRGVSPMTSPSEYPPRIESGSTFGRSPPVFRVEIATMSLRFFSRSAATEASSKASMFLTKRLSKSFSDRPMSTSMSSISFWLMLGLASSNRCLALS